MSRLRVGLIVAGALTVAGAVAATWWVRKERRTPLYSLERLAEAVHDRDRLAVEEYLDVRRVAESIVADAIAAATAQAAVDLSTQGGWEALGSAVGLRMIEGMKPSLVTLLEQSIWVALTDSSTSVSDTRVTDMVGGPLDVQALAERFQGIADVRERNNVARVGARIRVEDVDSTVVVYLRMERADGHWRVVAAEELARQASARSLVRTRERAYEATMKSDLRNLVVAQEAHFADHLTYARFISSLGYYVTSSGVSVEIVEANRDGWRAVARHQETLTQCRMAIGSAVAPGDVEAVPECSRANQR